MIAFLLRNWQSVSAVAVLGLIVAYVAVLRAERDHYLKQRDSLQAELVQVKELGNKAKREAAEKQTEQDRKTKEVKNAYTADVARIRAYYQRRLRDADARSSVVPAAPDCSGKPDGAAAEPVAREADPRLEQSCALDALQVMRLQDFLRKNGFPVSR